MHHVATRILVQAIIVLCAIGACATSASAAPARTITYSTGVMGLDLSRAERAAFADVVAATLNDPRGWSLDNAVRFREVRSGGEFQVTLAAARTVGSIGACSAWWSCRSGHLVLINEMRWNGASPIYPVPVHLHAYRHLVINHEVGHALGFGHAGCPRGGADAPVMQQQSVNLGGCRPNPWPLDRERRALASRLGVRVGPHPQWLLPGHGARGITIGMSTRAVRARIGAPQHSRRTGRRTIERFVREQVVVEFERGLVAAVTTRNPHDVTRLGIGVGTPAPRVRAIPGIACPRPDAAGVTRCTHGRDTHAGDRTTTYVLHRGRTLAVRVARRTNPITPVTPA